MCTAKQIDYLFSNWSVSNRIAIRSYKSIKVKRICLYVKLNHAREGQPSIDGCRGRYRRREGQSKKSSSANLNVAGGGDACQDAGGGERTRR